MQDSPYDYLFRADLRHWSVYQITAEYWEVTKDGKLIHHEDLSWKTPLTKISINANH